MKVSTMLTIFAFPSVCTFPQFTSFIISPEKRTCIACTIY